MTRVAVLASGSGSNLQAMLDQEAGWGLARSARVVLVLSDQPEAGALQRARDAGITALYLDRTARTTGLTAILATHRIELIVLAGYLRLVPADVVAHYRGRILNIHPALLPDFGGPGMYGHHVHEAVLASGARLTGPTVHFVDERFDNGPIIAHLPIQVLPTDTPESLARRVLEIEHELYPRIIEAVADGSITLASDNSVVLPEGVHFHFTPAADREDANRQITNAFFPLPY